MKSTWTSWDVGALRHVNIVSLGQVKMNKPENQDENAL